MLFRHLRIFIPLVTTAVIVACAPDAVVTPKPSPIVWHHDTGCNPETAIIPCDPSGTGLSNDGVNIGADWNTCINPPAGDDDDEDQVSNECEQALAAGFAPGLQVSSVDGIWEPGRQLLGGEYYFAVRSYTSQSGQDRMRIAYLPAYYKDMGDIATGASSHDGDSEFIIIDVTYIAQRWYFLQAFLSAHCGADNGVDCQWWGASYWDSDGRWVNSHLGAPVIWVSEDKHANYYSLGKCRTGSYGFDYCNANDTFTRFPVTPGFNIGDIKHPLVGFVEGRRGSPYPSPGATESMWDQSRQFYGWQATRRGGSLAYGEILWNFGFFRIQVLGTREPECTDSRYFFCPGA
jgi:hypothetical protein